MPDPQIGFWATVEIDSDGLGVGFRTIPFAVVFPWAMALPKSERQLMLDDVADSDDPAQTLLEWQHTAEAWADPEVLDVLAREHFTDDYVDIPRPGG
jgi:hypothetical protein